MTGWEYGDVFDILQNAFEGNAQELEKLLREYPFAKVSPDYKTLLVLRKFQELYYKGSRSVLNAAPEGEHFHWGITIANVDEHGGSSSNVYLPNKYNYTGLELDGENVVIKTDGFQKNTNISEMFIKLEFFLDFDEKELEIAFDSLENTKYEVLEKVVYERPLIKHKILGTLVYDETLDWYSNQAERENKGFYVAINDLPPPEEMEALLDKIGAMIQAKYYEKNLEQMVPSMLELKNDSWLEEDEKELTPSEFRKRISISSISFYNDFSSTIYCHDDDLFWGHSIQVSVDSNGNFREAWL